MHNFIKKVLQLAYCFCLMLLWLVVKDMNTFLHYLAVSQPRDKLLQLTCNKTRSER